MNAGKSTYAKAEIKMGIVQAVMRELRVVKSTFGKTSGILLCYLGPGILDSLKQTL